MENRASSTSSKRGSNISSIRSLQKSSNDNKSLSFKSSQQTTSKEVKRMGTGISTFLVLKNNTSKPNLRESETSFSDSSEEKKSIEKKEVRLP